MTRKKAQIAELYREIERIQGLAHAAMRTNEQSMVLEKNQDKIAAHIDRVSGALAAFGDEFLRLDWIITPQNDGAFHVTVRRVPHVGLAQDKLRLSKYNSNNYWQEQYYAVTSNGDSYTVSYHDAPSNKLNVHVDDNGYLQAVLEETETPADPNLKEAWGETVAEAQDLVLDLIDEFVRDFTFGPESDEVARLSGTVVL